MWVAVGDNTNRRQKYLYLELSTLLQAGVNLKSSFELVMADDQHKGKDKTLFEEVQQAVLGGTTFSQALQQSGRFSPLVANCQQLLLLPVFSIITNRYPHCLNLYQFPLILQIL
ncbi:type II secretion system F family protein [Mucilaginibacter sp.]